MPQYKSNLISYDADSGSGCTGKNLGNRATKRGACSCFYAGRILSMQQTSQMLPCILHSLLESKQTARKANSSTWIRQLGVTKGHRTDNVQLPADPNLQKLFSMFRSMLLFCNFF